MSEKQSTQRSYGNQLARAVCAAAILLLAVFSSIALGAQEQNADAEAGGFPVPSTAEELKDLTSESEGVRSEPVINSDAADELPHTHLERTEAEDLFTSVFPSAIEEQAGVYGDLKVEAFRSDHVAVVPAENPNGEPGLVSSLLPLRVENEEGQKEVVSLALEDEGAAGLAPLNPLVQVQIPASISQGIEMPDVGVSIDIQDVADRDASTISNAAAFYANIANESDLSIVPTPTGVETLTQLRSPAAPLTQHFYLSLPSGAQLRASDDGGAVVTAADGSPLLVMRPPTAIDANGDVVEVNMRVAGSTIALTASPRESAAYPILVDPVFESYSWMNSNTNSGIYTDWRAFSSNEAVMKPSWIGVWNQTMHSGLNLRSYLGGIAPGSQANWNYYVPRYFTDYQDPAVKERPTTYIRNINLSQIYFLIEEGSPVHVHPYMLAGLWNEKSGIFASSGTRNSLEGPLSGSSLPLTNPDEVADVKNGGVALTTAESTSYPRQLFVGSASVEITDKDFPGWGEVQNVDWVSSQTSEIKYRAFDKGLGVHDLRIRYAAARGGRAESMITLGCTGAASSACPRTATTATKPLLFDAGALAQGENWVELYAVDPVGHWSIAGTGESRIRVDREQPELGLSGTLTEQKTLGSNLTQYSLKLDVKDGDEATATAAAPIGTVGTGTGQIERPFGIAADASGNTWVADSTNQRVVELDKNGAYIRQITGIPGNSFKKLRGITVAPNGSIFVADAENHMVAKFSGSGEFNWAFTTGGTVEPFDLSVDANGIVWVTEPNNKKVYRYKENGTLEGTISIPQPWGGVALPFGIDVDEYGNAWVALQGSNQIAELNSSGSVLFSFGKEGSEAGQFKAPFDVSIAPSGNIFVSDGLNNRIQEFKPDGGFMRQFGALGPASNQLENPKNIEVAPGNKLLVADYGNRRIARWDHADRHVESGAVKSEVKVDGGLVDTYAPGCAAGKNCSLSREWVMKADNYSVGSHKVDVITTDGVGLKSEKALTVETHGDLQAPALALSGTMTEQATLGNTRPTYKLKVAATDPGSTEERKSGVASTSIKVNGTTVDSSSPGCTPGGCSITREWTLNSSSYAAGNYTVEAKATDAAGRSTTKTLSIKIERDTAPPQMTLSGALPGAPEGWVQEGTRSATADATDEGGYGVRQIRFLIDGVVVGESLTQTCEAGGCPKSKTFWIDMTTYSGGAHEAVMAAEDGAGNVRKKTWTINLDPEGHISASEAEDTLEAVQATAEVEILQGDPSSGMPMGEDWGEDPTLQNTGEAIHSVGTPVEAELTTDPSDGFKLHTADGTVSIQPTSVGEASTELSTGNGSAISTGTSSGVDTVIRPIFDGSMTFQTIREPTSLESFSWTVSMSADQSLKLINSQFAEVYTDDHPNFGIIAENAHDATGISVPTTLSVAGNVLTLTVHHRAGIPTAGGAPFTYPITQGLGWEGGLRTYSVNMPPPTVDANGEVWGGWGYVSPPEPIVAADDPEAASASSVYGSGPKKRFTWVLCSHSPEFTPEGYPLMDLADGSPEWEAECGNPWTGDKGHNVRFYETVRGKFIQRSGADHSDFSTWHEGSQSDAIGCMAGGYGLDHEAGSGTFRRGKTNQCVWWGETQDSRPKYATWGEHLTAVHRGIAEERSGCGDHCNGTPNPWVEHDMPPMAYYFWANTHYAKHVTNCIDC